MYETGPLDPVMYDLYTRLDAETRIVVQQRTSEIRTLMRRTAQDSIEIGQKLIEVKAKLDHGLFGTWLSVEFEWSLQTAKRFMNVAQRFQNQQIVDFDMAPSALYLLAAPSSPESACEEALLRAEEGEQITHRVAQEIVAAHKAMPTFTEQEPATRSPRLGHAEQKPSTDGIPAVSVRRHPSGTLVLGAPELTPATGAVASSPVGVTNKMAVHFSSRTAEHYTPETIIVSTLACLGEIDLDPCSDVGDPPNIPAHMHYTVADDGLAHPWSGRIYLNPPYGREIGDWVEKLCFEHEAGRLTEAIALLPSRTDTQWWRRLRAYPVCFVQGRLTFVGSDDPAPFPSAVFYLGSDVGKFCRAFDHLGDVYRRIVIEGQR
jgi:hypothetical protein